MALCAFSRRHPARRGRLPRPALLRPALLRPAWGLSAQTTTWRTTWRRGPRNGRGAYSWCGLVECGKFPLSFHVEGGALILRDYLFVAAFGEIILALCLLQARLAEQGERCGEARRKSGQHF